MSEASQPSGSSSLPVDIVLLPSDELAGAAVKISRQVQHEESQFELNETSGPFPHVSLYMTQINIADMDKVQELLGIVADTIKIISVTAGGYSQDEGYIDANYAKTIELEDLQDKVISMINPIRNGLRERDKARIVTAEGVEKENLERYGYRSVGVLFRPHLSLTRFKDNRPLDQSFLPDMSIFNGELTRLGLFEMGDNGTCVRKIVDFELSSRK